MDDRFRPRVENIAEPLDGEARLVKLLPDLSNPQHRHAHPAGQHVEGHQFSDGEVAVDDELGAKEKDGGGDEVAHELDNLRRDIAEAGDTKARGDVGGQLFLPATLHLRLDRQRLQGLDAGDALNEEGLVFRPAPKFFIQPLAEQRRSRRRNCDIEGEGSEHDHGQPSGVDEHHAQEDDGEEKIDDEGQG